MKIKKRKRLAFSNVDLAVRAAIETARNQPENREIPDEWWEQVAGGLSDSRACYELCYQPLTENKASQLLEKQIIDWHRKHKSKP